MKEIFNILKIIYSAKKNLAFLGDEIGPKIDELNKNKNKSKYIQYIYCDNCLKKCFIEKQPFISGGDILDNLGKCELCGFYKTREFVYIDRGIYGSAFYKDIRENSKLDSFYGDIFMNNLLEFYNNYDETNEFFEIKKMLSRNSEIFVFSVRNSIYNHIFELKKIYERGCLSEAEDIYNIILNYYDINKFKFIFKKILDIGDLENSEIYKSVLEISIIEDESKKSIEMTKVLSYTENLLKEIRKKGDIFVSELNKKCADNARFYNGDIFYDEILYSVTSGDIWVELAGRMSTDLGTIDKISDVLTKNIYFVNQNNKNKICLLFECEISTETYYGGEYFDNGSDTIFIEVEILENNNCNFKMKLVGML